jgi:glutamate N-acetyltransferase / amino-acid N-acetyltransferase
MIPFYPIPGIQIGTALAQIKQAQRDDLTLFEIAPHSTCAAVFTRNVFCAAPVTVARTHLQTHTPRYLLINSGNANAGLGERGIQDALTTCEAITQLTGCAVQEILPFSTGVIGMPLPTDKIRLALPQAVASLVPDGWEKAARAIMTTDTFPKLYSLQTEIQGQPVTITGIAKGAGMIKPDMATMLAFLATDAKVPAPLLQTCLQQAVNNTFNRITVDGDTSTNDACVLIATGQGVLTLDSHSDTLTYRHFCARVQDVCHQLATAIVKDGEGATKFITVIVEQGESEAECLQVAYAIAHSPLVKTAFFASDPNWGRILAAVGRAGLTNLNIRDVNIYLDDVCIVKNGAVADTYTEAQGREVMSRQEIVIRIWLGHRGHHHAHIHTCDFSYDYVKINAEYRT